MSTAAAEPSATSSSHKAVGPVLDEPDGEVVCGSADCEREDGAERPCGVHMVAELFASLYWQQTCSAGA